MKVTVGQSTHPDYRYFVKTEVGTRSRSSHLETADQVDAEVASARAAAERHGVAIEVQDNR